MKNKKNSKGIAGIRQKTHKSVDKIMDKAEKINEKSHEEINSLKAKATEIKDNVKEKAIEIKENVDGFIEKNPEKSVLIAAGIGAVAGAALAAAILKKKTVDPAESDTVDSVEAI